MLTVGSGYLILSGRRKLFTKEEKVLLNQWIPDLSAATSDKWQPLHSLAASGQFYLVNALLKHNVDINIQDKDGWTPLHLAVQTRKTDIVRLMLIKGADKTVKNQDHAILTKKKMQLRLQTAVPQNSIAFSHLPIKVRLIFPVFRALVLTCIMINLLLKHGLGETGGVY
ncbi:hypothetical protein Vadar_001450 [Vaccinium darrowii]|uniref:Uncharacterized protein n=1 Tax=Vaccinium darrowii TaxID=229202 RepID=A0ACB7YKJ5_9ERIC|nr:hypothetical protein Vadar_001450 [Vaccinium darrowii]